MDFMDLMIQKDILHLDHESEIVRWRIERLRHDHAMWARGQNKSDPNEIAKDLNMLESELTEMLANSIFLCSRCTENGSNKVLDCIRQASGSMKALLQDIKKTTMELNKASSNSGETQHLAIDFGRLSKLIGKIQRKLRNGKEKMDLIETEGDDVWH